MSKSSPNNLIFSNPFEGRATPIDAYVLCLIQPSTFIKLMGFSMQRALTQLFGESVYKRYKYGASSEKLLQDIAKAASKNAPEMLLTDVLVRAAAGDTKARETLDSKSDYTAFIEGIGGTFNTIHNAHLLAVEAAIQPIRRFTWSKDFSGAAKAIRADTLLQRFVPKEMLDTFDAEPTEERLALIKITSILETHLSLIAASEIQRQVMGKLPIACFDALLPTKSIHSHSPNALFFAWFKRVSKSRSLASMARKLELAGQTINTPSLKRWNLGKVLPDQKSMKILSEVLMTKEDLESVDYMRFSAKMLNFIGHLAETTRIKAEQLIANGFNGNLGHWPEYPFGCNDYVEWVNTRYRYWYEFHLEQQSKRNSPILFAT